MNFNFGEVLSRAWQIIWKHKVLWIFGILASCGQGSGRYNSSNSGGNGNGGTGPANLPPALERLVEFISQNVTTFIVLAVSLVCIFWILSIFLGTIGRIGLIRGTGLADGGTERLLFGPLFSESMPYFWRVFGLSLILAIPILIFVLLLVAGVVVFASTVSATNNPRAFAALGTILFVVACMCVLVPIMWVLGLIFKQAERAIVLEGMPVMPALSRAWNIFRTNLGPVLVMAIILLVIGVVAGFIIAIPIFVVAVPAFLAFASGNGQNWNPLIIALVLLCLYAPISLLLNGIVISYSEAAWTLTFLRLTRKPDDNMPVIQDTGLPPSGDEGDRTVISSPHA